MASRAAPSWPIPFGETTATYTKEGARSETFAAIPRCEQRAALCSPLLADPKWWDCSSERLHHRFSSSAFFGDSHCAFHRADPRRHNAGEPGMRQERPDRRRNRAPAYPSRRSVMLSSEADYIRACARACDLHAAARHPMAEVELENLALAILTWEARGGGPNGT
jgi:hypothetical protein